MTEKRGEGRKKTITKTNDHFIKTKTQLPSFSFLKN